MADIDVAYQDALDYLYRFVDYSLTRNLRNLPEKFDLGRMHALMQRLGNPHRQYPVVHVAGTKGKGSVSALIESGLRAAGQRVGFYTSPHLQDYAERVQVSRQPITHEQLVALVEELKPHIEAIPRLTTFELTTALGFLYFARQQVDVAVIEVGLGGRLDATNVVDPLVAVITSLSYDHMNVLGDTLAQIAGEKAGIIKPGRPVVIAPQKEEARQVLERVATERQSPLVQVGREYGYAPLAHTLDGQSFQVWAAEEREHMQACIDSGGRQPWQPLRLNIPLLGAHQVENAATAYAALQTARQAGLRLSEEDIQKGFAGVVWNGRFEVLHRNPLLIVDSAHNRDSALKLRLALDDYLPGRPVILVFGASEDKDIEGMFAELLPRARLLIATQSVHPRAMNAGALAEMARQNGREAQAILPLEQALGRALALAGQEAAVVVTGSLFVAAAARSCWLKSVNPVQLFSPISV